MPTESRTLQSLGKFFHATESLQIAEAICRCRLFGQKINEDPLQSQGFRDGFPFHLGSHKRGGSHADGAGLTGESDLVDPPSRRLAHEYGDLVSARRVVTFSLDGGWREFAKIPGPLRVIQDDRLVQFVYLHQTPKYRMASRNTSTRRSISLSVL